MSWADLLRGRDDAHRAATALGAELHGARDEREQRVVTTAAHTVTGVELGAALANQDLAGVDDLSAEALDAESLRVGVAAVAAGRRALLVSHRSLLPGGDAGDAAVEKKDNERALAEYRQAAELVPDNVEMVYWHAVALVNMGRVDDSLPLFRHVFAKDGNWAALTPRLAKVGLLPDDKPLLQRILQVQSAR